MPRQVRATTTRASLLDYAAQVFEERGFLGAKLTDVANRASVTKGAVYFHFESKEALAAAIIVEQHKIARSYADNAMENGQTALERMLLMCAGLAEQLVTQVVVRAGIRLTTDRSVSLETVSGPYLDWMSVFEMLIEGAKQDGDFKPDVDAKTAARFIIPAYTGVQLVSDALEARRDLFQRIAEMWRLILPALSVPARLEGSMQLVDSLIESRGRLLG